MDKDSLCMDWILYVRNKEWHDNMSWLCMKKMTSWIRIKTNWRVYELRKTTLENRANGNFANDEIPADALAKVQWTFANWGNSRVTISGIPISREWISRLSKINTLPMPTTVFTIKSFYYMKKMIIIFLLYLANWRSEINGYSSIWHLIRSVHVSFTYWWWSWFSTYSSYVEFE